LLTLTLALFFLAAFTSLSLGQNRKLEDASVPTADKVTLSGNSSIPSKKCSVTARPGRTNATFNYPNYHYVNFERFVNSNWVALPPNDVVTNSQGVTPARIVPWNARVRAWITKQNGQRADSNEFNCGNPPASSPS
jgi:hypothetical protein